MGLDWFFTEKQRAKPWSYVKMFHLSRNSQHAKWDRGAMHSTVSRWSDRNKPDHLTGWNVQLYLEKI